MVSTRGRYALRVMIDLAEHRNEGYVPMKDVAARQELSLKYLEQILPILVKGGLIRGVHGKGGGYCLMREPEEYVVGEILRLTEKEMSVVACLAEDAPPCSRRDVCKTLDFWKGYNAVVNEYINGKTLADFL